MDDDDELPCELDNTVRCIRDASRIVRPSELLRTKVLQRARQRERDRRSDRIILRAVMALVVCSLLLMFTASKLDAWQDEPVRRATWAGMQERAAEIAAERRIAVDASLCEAYLEWRSDLAQRWRNPTASSSTLP